MKRIFAPLIEGVKLVVKSPAVVLINLFGTALLAAAVMLWLPNKISTVPRLILDTLVAVLITIAWWWLDAGTAAYTYRASRGDAAVRDSYRQGLRRALLFGMLAVIWIGLWLLFDGMREFARDLGSLVYSKLSAANRGRVGYQGVQGFFIWILDLKQWFLLTAIILPWVTMLCGAPLSRDSAKAAVKSYTRIGYWIGLFVAVVVAVWIPAVLVEWRFGTGLEAEMASMIVRLSFAFVLFIFGWLLALAVSAIASRPDEIGAAPLESAAVSG